MVARIMLVAGDDAKRRQVEDLLADQRTSVRNFASIGRELPWAAALPPDLLVLLALGRTGEAVEVVRAALAAEPDLSVLIVDQPSAWPEALLHLPGVAVVTLDARGGFLPARARLLERRRLLRERAARTTQVATDRPAADSLLGELPAVREMRGLLERDMDAGKTVVLAGEPGTLRRRILRHLLAQRGEASAADVISVDDIDRRSPTEQSSLLRLIQAGHRIVATATPDYETAARDGRFRSDLFYRLGGRPARTLPLRERKDDLQRLAGACGLPLQEDNMRAVLISYDWPGNLRELELVAEHARLVARGGPIEDRHVALPELSSQRLPTGSFVLRIPDKGVPLEQVEREAIRQTLEASDSNITEAARRLAVERGKLRYRLRKFGLGR